MQLLLERQFYVLQRKNMNCTRSSIPFKSLFIPFLFKTKLTDPLFHIRFFLFFIFLYLPRHNYLLIVINAAFLSFLELSHFSPKSLFPEKSSFSGKVKYPNSKMTSSKSNFQVVILKLKLSIYGIWSRTRGLFHLLKPQREPRYRVHSGFNSAINSEVST